MVLTVWAVGSHSLHPAALSPCKRASLLRLLPGIQSRFQCETSTCKTIRGRLSPDHLHWVALASVHWLRPQPGSVCQAVGQGVDGKDRGRAQEPCGCRGEGQQGGTLSGAWLKGTDPSSKLAWLLALRMG